MCFSKVIKETRCRQLRSSVLWVDETEKRLQTNYRLLMSWRFRSLLRGMRLRVIPFNFMQHCCWFVGFGKLWLVYIVGRAMSSLPTPTVQVRLSNVSLFDGWSTSLIKGFLGPISTVWKRCAHGNLHSALGILKTLLLNPCESITRFKRLNEALVAYIYTLR